MAKLSDFIIVICEYQEIWCLNDFECDLNHVNFLSSEFFLFIFVFIIVNIKLLFFNF